MGMNVKKREERRVWVESSNHSDIHREALVVGEDETRLKVHFISYSTKYDIWINKTSHRIKKERPRGEVLLKGDNLSCWSTQFKGWLEAEVVSTGEARVQLAWVGNNEMEPF